ncbi:hypothetical protein SEA_EYRE_66 [Gordonia phage Eyre]|uniref:Uncharacterized protein n=1 Tax=Gordonia phage Eyre TaxID=1887646 RepID=A0A1B3B025_9CAUD|nr:hypothetical protein BIZ73_gp66 [Gordonia phage Eyre]AOE44353.1 hypothetical protein SEA_EYRE_66 [Gordonia phage Eyre]
MTRLPCHEVGITPTTCINSRTTADRPCPKADRPAVFVSLTDPRHSAGDRRIPRVTDLDPLGCGFPLDGLRSPGAVTGPQLARRWSTWHSIQPSTRRGSSRSIARSRASATSSRRSSR